jgi:hypothetical protein
LWVFEKGYKIIEADKLGAEESPTRQAENKTPSMLGRTKKIAKTSPAGR